MTPGGWEGQDSQQPVRALPSGAEVPSPILIVDVVPEARCVDDCQLHADALLLNICRQSQPLPSSGGRLGTYAHNHPAPAGRGPPCPKVAPLQPAPGMMPGRRQCAAVKPPARAFWWETQLSPGGSGQGLQGSWRASLTPHPPPPHSKSQPAQRCCPEGPDSVPLPQSPPGSHRV